MLNRLLPFFTATSLFLWAVLITVCTCFACQWIGKPVEDVFKLAKNADAMLLLNPNDPADEQINLTLYRFAASLSRSLRQTDDIRFLMQDLPYDANGAYALDNDSLLSKHLDMASQYKAVARANHWPEMTFAQMNQLIYKGGHYKLCISCYNRKAAVPEQEVIIAVGESIGEEDVIPGWKIRIGEGNAVYEPVRISEADSTLSTPIFVISNASNEPEVQKYFITLSEADIQSRGLATTPHSWTPVEYQIQLPYERFGKSDYYQNHRIFFSNRKYSSFTTDGQMIAQIGKEDMGKSFFSNATIPARGEGYWFVTYEKDWYSAHKPVFISGNDKAPTWVYAYCRMKYFHEYYQTMVLTFSDNSPQTTNQKGFLKVVCH